jgi:hypothetical protein
MLTEGHNTRVKTFTANKCYKLLGDHPRQCSVKNQHFRDKLCLDHHSRCDEWLQFTDVYISDSWWCLVLIGSMCGQTRWSQLEWSISHFWFSTPLLNAENGLVCRLVFAYLCCVNPRMHGWESNTGWVWDTHTSLPPLPCLIYFHLKFDFLICFYNLLL